MPVSSTSLSSADRELPLFLAIVTALFALWMLGAVAVGTGLSYPRLHALAEFTDATALHRAVPWHRF